MRTCTAFVTYNKYGSYDWTRICVESYTSVFPDHTLLAVDHNHNSEELAYLASHNIQILHNPDCKTSGNTHGHGLDRAVNWAKDNGFDAIVFVEPDCLISQPEWYLSLIQSLQTGNSMAATWQHCFGPLHPCGSAWIIRDIPHSFTSVPRTIDEINNPLFLRHVNLNKMAESISSCRDSDEQRKFETWWNFTFWDCGLKNWFHLACANKTALCSSVGFTHFFQSHDRSPKELMHQNEHVRQLLSGYC